MKDIYHKPCCVSHFSNPSKVMSMSIAKDELFQFLKQELSWKLSAQLQMELSLFRTPKNHIFPVSLPMIPPTPDFAL